jgi:hypothetical protein
VEITLPAFVKDYEDVFSETEAGMLSQSILIRIRNRRISLYNLSEKELKIFTHSSSLFEKNETLDRSPPLRRKCIFPRS